MLDESCSSSSLHPTLTLVARSSSFFAASHLFFPSHGCRRKRQMTRVRMRQHEYYFIVQRRLARHYCWLEPLSRPTSVLAHDRRSLYASCAFLCVGLRTEPHHGAWVSACRPGASRHVPCLSFKRHLCGPFFCASLEVRRPPRITRAIAARTRQSTRHTCDDSRATQTAHDHVSREGTTTPQVTDSTLLHTRHTDGKGRSGGGGGSGARAEQRVLWSLLRAGARRLCAGSRVRPGGKAQASPWWRRRETRRRPAVAETRAFCTRRGER